MVLRARGGAGLDQMQADRFEQGWMALAHRHEDVGGEPSVAGARLDEIEWSDDSGAWPRSAAISAIWNSSSSPNRGPTSTLVKKSPARPERWAARA